MSLNVTAAESYRKMWEYGDDDIGSVSLFRVEALESYRVLGDIVEKGSVSHPLDLIPTFYPTEMVFANPVSFTLIWSDSTCSFWRPVPPDQYRAIGDFIQRGMNPPDVLDVYCVHESFVIEATLPYEENRSCIWPDVMKDPLPDPPISIWRIEAPSTYSKKTGEPLAFGSNYFITSPSFERPQFPVYALRNPLYTPDSPVEEKSTNVLEDIIEKENSSSLSELLDSYPIEEVEYIPISIDVEEASAIYAKWINDKWFAPTTLKTQVPEARLLYIPHFTFSTVAISEYSLDVLPIGDLGAIWLNEDFTRRTEYSDMIFIAIENNEIIELIEPLIENLTLKDLKVSNIDNAPPHLDICNPSLRWNDCEKMIQEREKQIWFEESQQTFTEVYKTRNFKINSKFVDIAFRVTLLPFYMMEYTYEDKKYRFIVNAQNGLCNGTRPVNILGGLTNWWSKTLNPGIYIGSQLISEDPKYSKTYKPKLFYLIFPPSDTKYFTYQIGWIKLKNESNNLIQFRAKQKGTTKTGIIYNFLPGDTKFFPYRGQWVLEIVFGEANMLKLVSQSGTSTEKFPDLLGIL